jgi:WD40 repeat protein
MNKHTILFLAANPPGTDRLALDREARAIQVELERSGHRDQFELVTRWAVQPIDLLRELRKLRPTVVHFSGHGGATGRVERVPRHDLTDDEQPVDGDGRPGLIFDGADGRPQQISTAALQDAFGAAGATVRVVVLSACYSETQAVALLAHVDCVVGVGGLIGDDAARNFAIGFYGGLGERASVASAYRQGCAAISLEAVRDNDRPQLKIRDDVDADQLVLSAVSPNHAGFIDFTVERQRHIQFVGRDDVLDQLDEWLDGPREVGWVLVTGGPGMGKSAILAAWLARREARGTAVPHHFIRRQVADWDQPEVIAISLAAQIEATFPALRDVDAQPERRLIELLGRVSNQLGSTRRLVVVVDGLDETSAEPGENPLPRFLPHVVPTGIRFVCATRPTYPHLNWILVRSPAQRLDLDDARWAASNDAVVRGFWAVAAGEYRPPLSAEMMAEAVARAEGNVLHAVMLHDALRELPAAARRADRIPRGLKGLIDELWDQAATHEAVRVGFGILCAAQEALSLDMLVEIIGWSYDEKQRFIRNARQLLLEESASWTGVEVYRPRHDWVRELISDRLGSATLKAHHVTLSRTLASWPPTTGVAATRYCLRHALIHRAEAGDWDAAWRLASDMGFLETKCREQGVHETETDVARAAELCRSSGNTVLCRRFDDLARTLGRESHWLRVAPEATAALVWNRLRRFDWSASDLFMELQLPAQTNFLRVRHAATRETTICIRDLVGHSGAATACAVTPDGRRVVSASADGTLKVWDLNTGRTLAALVGHALGVNACAVTTDGRRVVSASMDGTLKLWDLDSGCVLATLEDRAGWVTTCAVSPDGRYVISASDDSALTVRDLETGRVLATLRGHTGVVRGCVLTTDGRRVVSASDDGTLKVWNLETGIALASLNGHTRPVRACAVTSDGRRVVSASEDGTLKVWDLERGCATATLEGHALGVTACATTADGRRVISGSEDRTLRIWDLESGRALATLEGHTGWVMACAVTADGRRVVSASHDGTLKVWNLDHTHALVPVDSHASLVTACAVSANGLRAVSASWDHTLKVWDVWNRRAHATLQGPIARVTSCALTPDGRRAVSASWDGRLIVWDLQSGGRVAELYDPELKINACAVTVDGRRVVSAAGSTLKVWDLVRRRVLASLEGHTRQVTACAVTGDGRRAVSASMDRTLKVWNLQRRALKLWSRRSEPALTTLEGHAAEVMACAVTANGWRVVSGSKDQTLKVWDIKSGRLLATMTGHMNAITACAVTADDRYVISASEDRTLKVWDLETYSCLLTHRGDTPYFAVAVSTTPIVVDDILVIVAGDGAGGVWFLEWRR